MADSKRWEESILEEESECPRPTEGTEVACFGRGMTIKCKGRCGRKVGQTGTVKGLEHQVTTLLSQRLMGTLKSFQQEDNKN